MELNEEGQNLMKKQQARLGRSLERLSTELYSKDTHFVLELIQVSKTSAGRTLSVSMALTEADVCVCRTLMITVILTAESSRRWPLWWRRTASPS